MFGTSGPDFHRIKSIKTVLRLIAGVVFVLFATLSRMVLSLMWPLD